MQLEPHPAHVPLIAPSLAAEYVSIQLLGERRRGPSRLVATSARAPDLGPVAAGPEISAAGSIAGRHDLQRCDPTTMPSSSASQCTGTGRSGIFHDSSSCRQDRLADLLRPAREETVDGLEVGGRRGRIIRAPRPGWRRATVSPAVRDEPQVADAGFRQADQVDPAQEGREGDPHLELVAVLGGRSIATTAPLEVDLLGRHPAGELQLLRGSRRRTRGLGRERGLVGAHRPLEEERSRVGGRLGHGRLEDPRNAPLEPRRPRVHPRRSPVTSRPG